MKLSRGEKIVYSILILVLIMVNPPIVSQVSTYAETHPFILGWPTLLVWLNFWYAAGIVAFLIGALKIKSWRKDYKEPEKEEMSDE